MAHEETAKQFSFRVPEELVASLEQCIYELWAKGLDLTSADAVRMHLKNALDRAERNIVRGAAVGCTRPGGTSA